MWISLKKFLRNLKSYHVEEKQWMQQVFDNGIFFCEIATLFWFIKFIVWWHSNYAVRYLKLFQYSTFSKQRIIIFLPFSVIGSLLNLDFAVNMETWRLMVLAFYLPLENWNIVWLMSRTCLNLTLPSLESRNIPSQNISHCIMWLILSMMLNEKCRKFQTFQPKNNY